MFPIRRTPNFLSFPVTKMLRFVNHTHKRGTPSIPLSSFYLAHSNNNLVLQSKFFCFFFFRFLLLFVFVSCLSFSFFAFVSVICSFICSVLLLYLSTRRQNNFPNFFWSWLRITRCKHFVSIQQLF